MRLDQVYHQLDAIRRKFGHGQRNIDQGQLQQYSIDGTVPGDPLTLAYVRLTEAAGRCMDLSVAGTDTEREQAAREYQETLDRWNEVTK